MDKNVKINDIIKFLEENSYEYIFEGNYSDEIIGFSSLFNYKENSITFISPLNSFLDYQYLFNVSKIQLIITDFNEGNYSVFNNQIKINNPKKIFFDILDRFFDSDTKNNFIKSRDNYFNHSFISENAIIGKNVKIGVGCIIEDDVEIGDNTVIHHNVVIRNRTKIGKNCSIFSGAIIGERGFNPNKLEDGTRNMLKHYGGVVIEDNVHIGDNCCINKGSIDDTVIKKGVKLNTMVHIAHNCIIGENTVISMPTHICGSVSVGKNCHIAATTIRNQCAVGDNAVLGLGSVVVKDVAAGTIVVGNPAKPLIKK